MGRLAYANLLLFVLLTAHTIDHAVNQPTRDLPGSAALVGAAGFGLVAASTFLALRRSELALPVSVFTSMATFFGFLVVHLIPRWSDWVSDPFWDFHPDALSWALLAAPMLASLLLGFVTLLEVRSYREAASEG